MKEIANLPLLSEAFQRVKENRGCAEVDGIMIEDFEKTVVIEFSIVFLNACLIKISLRK